MEYKSIKLAKNKRFKELKNNIELNKCTDISLSVLSVFFNNVHYIFKQRKLTYNAMRDHYKAKGININKGYVYKLSKLKTYKTCNILMLVFIANYINIPLLTLLTTDLTIKHNTDILTTDSIKSF